MLSGEDAQIIDYVEASDLLWKIAKECLNIEYIKSAEFYLDQAEKIKKQLHGKLTSEVIPDIRAKIDGLKNIELLIVRSKSFLRVSYLRYFLILFCVHFVIFFRKKKVK